MMNIILVSGKLSKARSLTLTVPHFLLGAAIAVCAVLVCALVLQYAMLRYATAFGSPLLNALIASVQHEQNQQSQNYLQDNLNAMAAKLGEMQAELLRLDTLGERMAKSAGFKPQDFMFGEAPARGGAESTVPTYNLTMGELGQQLDQLTRRVEQKSEQLGVLNSLMIADSAKKKMVPTLVPVDGGWYSSNFGWRIDPFSGARAFHEGMDFMADVGTPAHAAAGGVVVYADWHPQYGNMIEIDHGNGLITRYAHLSRRQVKVGDVVMSGEQIGLVGSTGRATGPHLHFEVRQNGSALDPTRYLRLPG
jgi:murein DD-endopeptidase MepM/ murein hydrolase activator NlpD